MFAGNIFTNGSLSARFRDNFLPRKFHAIWYVTPIRMLIVKDSERDHSMGSPMNRTPPRSEDRIEIVKSKAISLLLTILHDQQVHTTINHTFHHQSRLIEDT